MKAREAFAAGRYDEALDLFAKLYARDAAPRLPAQHRRAATRRCGSPRRRSTSSANTWPRTRRSRAEERKEIEGYIKEMEALRDEQAKAAPPPPPPRRRRSTPISPTPPPPREPPAAAPDRDTPPRRWCRSRRRPGRDADLQEVVVLDGDRRRGRGRRRRRGPALEWRDDAAGLSRLACAACRDTRVSRQLTLAVRSAPRTRGGAGALLRKGFSFLIPNRADTYPQLP